MVSKTFNKLSFNEVDYGYALLRQITNSIKKDDLDRDIFVKLHRDYPYSKRGKVHYYNQLYKDEVSRLIIKRAYIKLEVEQEMSSFFEVLKKYSDNFFVCDFSKLNYFFLK